MLIALYGINNIGKTYHALRLVRRLRALGKKAVYLKYPVYRIKPTGPMLDKILRKSGQHMPEEQLQLLFVLNRYQFQPELLKILKRNDVVIAEDYIGTGISWGLAKGANFAELVKMNKFLVQPDVAILMKGKRVLRAKEKKHIHEQNDALSEKCRRIFQKLGKRYGWKGVEVAEDREVTAARLWTAVKKYV